MICERAFLAAGSRPPAAARSGTHAKRPKPAIWAKAQCALYGELEGRGVWPLAGYDQWYDAQETKREQAARAREDAGLARRSTTQMTRCSGAETELSLFATAAIPGP